MGADESVPMSTSAKTGPSPTEDGTNAMPRFAPLFLSFNASGSAKGKVGVYTIKAKPSCAEP